MRISDWSSDVCSSDLDVRHDHQLVDDRVRRLGGDDARLGDADVARAALALLGVGDGGALHRTLHRAGAAAGADVQAAQAQLVADVLGVLVLVAVDGVAAPADDEVGVGRRSEEHTSELQSLMRISYAVFCLKKKIN